MMNKRGQRPTIFPMKNRKGAEMSTNTIILIILGLIVLVVLALGFMIGWKTILPWLSPNNVNTIVTQCQAVCTTGDAYGYCSMERTLNAPDLPKEVKGNCTFFAKDANYEKYNIAECPGLCPTA